jgi:hypothetical protein
MNNNNNINNNSEKFNSIDTSTLTEEQIQNFTDYQNNAKFHPLTCPGNSLMCLQDDKLRTLNAVEGYGLICNCGKYVQNWTHNFTILKQKE